MRLPNLLLTSLLVLMLASCASSGTRIADYPSPIQALLVLDMQNDFVGADARMPIREDSKLPLIAAVNDVAAFAAQKGILVIYIRNEFPRSDLANAFRNNAAIKCTPGSELDPRVALVSQTVFDKDQPDAFSNPQLEAFLIAHQVNELVIAGVFADQCCAVTSQAALNRHYKVDYLVDGVGAGSRDSIQNAAASLRSQGATITTIDQWKSERE